MTCIKNVCETIVSNREAPPNTEDCVVPRKVRRQANYLRRRTRGL